MIFLFFALFVFRKCYSQCLQNSVQNTFNYECITGNFNGARIGIDSVIHTASGTGTLEVFGTFGAYLNGIYNVSFAYHAGDVIKIKPISIGQGVIEIISQEQGCIGSYNAEHIGCSSSLPVLWLSTIKVKPILNSFQITWSVATQINNEKYMIEHSTDGKHFSPIGEITGDGTSNITKHYEYIHTSPSIGMNYYRIKQVDYDGKYSYSDIASVIYDGGGETNIYPNPATSKVTITTSASTSVQVMDVYGRVLTKEDISEGQNTINLSAFPSGILIFVVGDRRFKVLKE